MERTFGAATSFAIGRPYPLGAMWDGDGVNFAIFSEHASQVDLCLFDRANETTESLRIPLNAGSGGVWQGYFPGIQPGQLYGYRAAGPYVPEKGHRYNPNKLLVDPYARALEGRFEWHDAVHGYIHGDPRADLSFDDRDSAPYVPKGIVIDPAFEWAGDRRPCVPSTDTVVYECHVKGMTARHPDVAQEIRGTYLGMASEPIIDHLQRLGITTVELLPVHHALDERRLVERGLVNYWGYNTLGFFAPDARYATGQRGQAVHEFKSMVKSLHAAGIEIILDVVYNHSAESDELGPTVSLRGFDNAVYYNLRKDDPRFYGNYAGCGNTLNARRSRTLQLILDSLRYWAEEMHVDGFRFDLATVLARGSRGMDHDGLFLATLRQDPVLADVKLIAEPWDLGPGGYQVGNFPAGWSDWNDKYRGTIRSFWRGDDVQPGELARRLSGSHDLFASRGPLASINYVTAHDGFTLHDLVSHERKHNEANGEANRDGEGHNLSRNWGAEGPTDDEGIIETRERIKRNLLSTLALSLGAPMICAGDEMGRSQHGNNNAYCQDNETTWIDWSLNDRQEKLLEFVRDLLALRREYPILRQASFFTGEPVCEAGIKDVSWLREDGKELAENDWHDAGRHHLGMMLHGNAKDSMGTRGLPMPPGTGGTQTLLLVLNGGEQKIRFMLPELPEPGHWMWRLNTALREVTDKSVAEGSVEVSAQSLALLSYR